MKKLLFIMILIILCFPVYGAPKIPVLTPMIHDAHWIWMKGFEDTQNKNIYMRRTFKLEAKPLSAELQISCDDHYKVWVNGKPVGETVRKGTDAWKIADTWSVLSELQEGDNYIAVQADNAQDKGALLAVLAVGCANDSVVTINTDSSWEAATEPGDSWQQSASQTGNWQSALDYGRSATTAPWFYPRTSTKLMDMVAGKLKLDSEVISSISVNVHPDTNAQITDQKSGSLTIQALKPGQKAAVVCDFGKEVVGYPILIGNTIGKCKIDFSFGEYEAECDSPYQTSLNAQFDRGGIRWSTSERRAFRYLKLTIEPESVVKIDHIQAEVIGCHVDETGSFECSDESLNKIWNVSRYTLRQCMQNYFEDGVKRDKLLWVADMRIEALVGYYTFGSQALAKRGLLQMADIQMPDGMIIAVGPNPSSTYLPDFCAYYVMALADYYRYSGDKDTIQLLYPNLQRLMAWFKSNCDETGMFRNADRPGWWMFLDWDESLDKKDRVMGVEALYYRALQDAAYMAQEVGEKKESRDYTLRAEQLKKTVNSTMWSDAQGAYIDCVTDQGPSVKIHKQPNALALLAGLPDSTKSESILALMFDASKMPPVTTPYMNFYVASALFEGGKTQQALDLIRSYWGGMIQRGATTFWEKFDPNWPNPYEQNDLSYCHGWSSGPGAMLPAYIAGIRPISPGFKDVLLAPELADLKWVKATVPAYMGKITVEWKQENGQITGNMNLPVRSHGLIRLPVPPDGTVYLLDGKRASYKKKGSYIEIQVTGGKAQALTLDSAPAKR